MYAVIYKSESGKVREWFKSVALAFEYAQAVVAYEGCRVWIRYGRKGPVTEVVA